MSILLTPTLTPTPPSTISSLCSRWAPAVACVALLCLLLPKGAHAEFNGKVYGAVNQAYLAIDNGRYSTAAVVNNHAYTTRLGYKGAYTGIADLVIGVKAEFGIQNVNSKDITLTQGDNFFRSGARNDSNAGDGDGLFHVRVLDVYLAGEWGVLTIGQGGHAGDGAAERDVTVSKSLVASKFSETWGLRNVFFTTAAYHDNDASTNYLNDAPTVGTIFGSQDSSRYARIRYDSGVTGVIFSVSHSPSTNCNNTTSSECGKGREAGALDSTNSGSTLETTEIALRVKYEGFDSGLSYTLQDPDKNRSNVNGKVLFSISGQFDGFGVAYAYTQQDYRNLDARKFHYIKFVITEGTHSLSLDYTSTSDVPFTDPIPDSPEPDTPLTATTISGQSIGLMMAHTFDKKVNIYYGYRTMSAEAEGRYKFEDVSGYIAGVLYKF